MGVTGTIRVEPISTQSIDTGRISASSIAADTLHAANISAGAISTAKISAKPIVAIPSVPATMRAAVYSGVDNVRVETVPVPVDADGKIGPGEVLVRIDTCGICGTDLKKIHTGSHSAPRIFGH